MELRCDFCNNNLRKEPFRKYAALRRITGSREVCVCVKCWPDKEAQSVIARGHQIHFPRGRHTKQGDDTMKDEFPDPPVAEEAKKPISRAADAARKRNEKAILKKNLATIEYVLGRFKELVDDFDLSEEESEELKELVRANRKYMREGKFEAATPASIVKAYSSCHREGINYILDRLRRPSPLRANLGYKCLRQAFQHVVFTKPPPPPAHPNFKLPSSHPDRTDYDGKPFWSKSKPRYEADKGETLAMSPPAIAARNSEKHRVENPMHTPGDPRSVYFDQT